MKLSLISEVFQTPSMDGVETRYSMYHSSDTIALAQYAFYDGEIAYKININASNYGSAVETIFNLSNIDPELVDTMYDTVLNQIKSLGGLPAYIDFEADGSYAKTGFGNEFFVYSKVIACVHDFVVKTKPIILRFSGYTSDMDRVYDRFVKMGNRMWPEYKYIPVSSEVYVTVPMFRFIRDIPGFMEEYDRKMAVRSNKLNDALKNKKLERQRTKQNTKQNSDPSLIDRFVGDL